jgi:high-affinity Fe2+/Pb2+ permease
LYQNKTIFLGLCVYGIWNFSSAKKRKANAISASKDLNESIIIPPAVMTPFLAHAPSTKGLQ